MTSSPYFPAEWAPHDAVWVGWPSAADLWLDDLAPAQEEVASLVRAIIHPDPEDPSLKGEGVHLVFRGDEARLQAEGHFDTDIKAGHVEIIEAPIGDIWLRDTGPVFLQRNGALLGARFQFNGWGGRFVLPSDEKIREIICDHLGVNVAMSPLVLEGGAIDTDGEGALLTTRQCLLNPNRNPGLSEEEVEAALRTALGVEKIIWLDEGLTNDHTDGHIDNIARFVAPGKVVCMRPTGDDDPNKEIYADILRTLHGQTDAGGRPLEIIEAPSPGLVTDEEGAPVPASHMNFYVANHSLIAPIYARNDEQEAAAELAMETLADCFDRPHVYAIDARHLLTGGGSFHCITQQQPSLAPTGE